MSASYLLSALPQRSYYPSLCCCSSPCVWLQNLEALCCGPDDSLRESWINSSPDLLRQSVSQTTHRAAGIYWNKEMFHWEKGVCLFHSMPTRPQINIISIFTHEWIQRIPFICDFSWDQSMKVIGTECLQIVENTLYAHTGTLYFC